VTSPAGPPVETPPPPGGETPSGRIADQLITTANPVPLRRHCPGPPLTTSVASATRNATMGSPAPLKRRGAGIRSWPSGLDPHRSPARPPASAVTSRVNHRRDSTGPLRHGLPCRGGFGLPNSGLRLGRKGLAGSGIAGMERRTRDLEGEPKAHGRNERQVTGNGDLTQRIRQRSKALKSAASRDSDEPRRSPPLRWERTQRPEIPQLRRRNPPSDHLRVGSGRALRATPGSESAPGGDSIVFAASRLRPWHCGAIFTRHRRVLRPPHAACAR
jgi:hypothetical protein